MTIVNTQDDLRDLVALELVRRGLSQRAAAEKLGVTQAGLCDWLSGARGVRLDTALRVVRALGLEVTVQRNREAPGYGE
ncbi:MAG: XRE family transcriptional regulator [Planctomycetota bacterium]|nr:MAG: XRE family transcriptional regulator [Planctomycetota bacterium]